MKGDDSITQTNRIGKISSLHYEDGTADVYFEDEEGSVKVALPFFSDEYRMPEVGDMVVVAFQSNSGSSQQGYILGTFYSEENRPECYGRGVYFKRFSDTAYIRYHPDTDTLEIHAGHVVIDNLREGSV